MKYYTDEVLNKPGNHVLFCTAGMYSEEGARDIVSEFCEDDGVSSNKLDARTIYAGLQRYVSMDYDDVVGNFKQVVTNPVVVCMRTKLWDCTKVGIKVIEPCGFSALLSNYGCDEYAFYYDRYNLHFIGYHHDSNCTPNTGVLRELTSEALWKLGSAQAFSARYFDSINKEEYLKRNTRSLIPYIYDMYGKPTNKKRSKGVSI